MNTQTENAGKHRLVLGSVLGIVVVSVVFLVYDYLVTTSCEGIFQQTRLNLVSSIEALEVKGEIGFSHNKIQNLTEKAQLVALNYKACCVAAENDLMTEGKFLQCKNSTDGYQSQLALAAQHLADARKTVEEGNVGEAEHSVSDAAAALTESDTALGNFLQTGLRMGELSAEQPRQSESGLIPPRKRATGKESEPNEGYDDANQIAVGDSISGNVSKTSQDWFALPVDPQKPTLHVKIRQTGGRRSCYAQFFSAEEKDLINFFTDDPLPGTDEAKTWEVPLAGTSAVFVKLYSSNEQGCNYELFTAYSPSDL